MPLQEIFDGFCIVAAGIMLMTPGFFTDSIGFTLLFPPARVALRHHLAQRFSFELYGAEGESPRRNDPHIIEGDYEKLDEAYNEEDRS